ncbi:hypothetical protein ACIP9H_33845 [Streptomyces sp. NPDC088732]|uniref:hypothetical protein n=1 Tax=Streptomyces sp. NPDC088732 TaxID=3365879 RepID=UPI003828BE28
MSGQPVTPTRVFPAAGHVPYVDDVNDPIVHVPDPYNPNLFISVRRSSLMPTAPTPPREPQPLIDPLAARMLGGGVGAGAAGWGAGQLLIGASQLVSAVAGAGSAVFAIALLLLVAKLAPSIGSGKQGKTVNITNHNRLWGRSSTRA